MLCSCSIDLVVTEKHEPNSKFILEMKVKAKVSYSTYTTNTTCFRTTYTSNWILNELTAWLPSFCVLNIAGAWLPSLCVWNHTRFKQRLRCLLYWFTIWCDRHTSEPAKFHAPASLSHRAQSLSTWTPVPKFDAPHILVQWGSSSGRLALKAGVLSCDEGLLTLDMKEKC